MFLPYSIGKSGLRPFFGQWLRSRRQKAPLAGFACEDYGRMSIGVLLLVSSQISSMSELESAMQPSVQSRFS
jgi:hypothetical protein